MKKIPTLFVRNPEDRRYVTEEVMPGCEWVFAGEGIATRKYDGTCVAYSGNAWWARREVKPGKDFPPGFVKVEKDDETGKTVGWEPIEQSPFYKFFLEAEEGEVWEQASYELCGPKIQGNPEGFEQHELINHNDAERIPLLDAPSGFAQLKSVLPVLAWEGVVWHHKDGRMAKLKKKDFPKAL